MASKPSKSNAKKTKTGPAGGHSRTRIQKARKEAAKAKPAVKAKKPGRVPLEVVTPAVAAGAKQPCTAAFERPTATVEGVSLGQVVVITDKLCPDLDAIGEVINIQGRGDSRIAIISVLLHSGYVVRVFRDGLRPGTADEVTRWLDTNGAGKLLVIESTPEQQRQAGRNLWIAGGILVAAVAAAAIYFNSSALAFWA